MTDVRAQSAIAAPTRRPHAVLDLRSRVWKAQKIERLLALDVGKKPIRLLEIGCGSGGIAHYFGMHPSGRFSVHAVDVVDSRLLTEGFEFATVGGTELPFPADSFDIVLSNHVIEHVGDESQQARHLSELKRVLAPEGQGYLAVPNRWMLIEPHFRLAFLSWLPKSWRSAYVRLMGRGEYYDCEPLELGQCERLLTQAGFEFENVCVAAARLTLSIEQPGSLKSKILDRMPDGILDAMTPIIPTLMYRLRHGEAG